MTGVENAALDRLHANLVQAALLPPPIVGPPVKRCPVCDHRWQGFDGDNRSVCCWATSMDLQLAHAATAAKPSSAPTQEAP